MLIKKMILAGTTALACLIGINAQAGPSMAACLSTPDVVVDGTVVDAALATPELSTLVDAVSAAGLVDALNDAENITVYAPTNDAFAAIPADVTAALLADVDALTQVLLYHVTPGVGDPRRYQNAADRPTLQGQKVYYQRYGEEARVGNAIVNCTRVKVTNGRVFLIDSVLFPTFAQ